MLERRWTLSLVIAMVLGAGALSSARGVTLGQVHGLSFSADGSQLLIATPEGLAVYDAGRWSRPAAIAADFRGFSVTRDALYSSGRAAPGSVSGGPFGLIKSSDGGKSWQKLGLWGESEFHALATSYETDAVCVANLEPNTRMRRTGIHCTLDDGIEWHRAAAKGLGTWLHNLAVHPTDARLVSAGTDEGLYLSRNSANSFERLVGGRPVLAQVFDLDGLHIWFSSYVGEATLARIALTTGARAEEVPLPPLNEDAVAFIAQNPARRSEMAFATFKRSLFLSSDRGHTWTQIAKEGAGLE